MARSHRVRHVFWLTLVIALATVGIVGITSCSRIQLPSPGAGGVSDAGTGSQSGPGSSAPAPPAAVTRPDPTVTPVPTVAVASDLAQQTMAGKALAPNDWAVKEVTLSFQVPAATTDALIPQVEVVKADQAFKGVPTTQGAPVSARDNSINARVTLKDLVPGQYKWQARFENAKTKRSGAWAGFANGDVAFGIVAVAPKIQNLTVAGASHTIGGVPAVNHDDQPSLGWTVSMAAPSALDHLALLADHEEKAPSTAPATSTSIDAATHTMPIDKLDDGKWYLHLWALDKAGQTSDPSTIALTMMRNPPAVSDVIYRSWVTNPLYQTVPIRFKISQDAAVKVSILPDKSDSPVRVYDLGQQTSSKEVDLSWDGKDSKGAMVAPSSYRFLVDAVDAVGNDSQALYNGITITSKVIKVSLSRQSMTAYEGDKAFVTTPVTSGGADIPTPTGTFEILEKAAPFVFHSPYPKGNKFWYPDVKSNYAMLFEQHEADFIHDAPWRSKFGPGTNGPGIPGQVYTGSHGCVETPASVMPRLFLWTPLGTPVVVAQ